MKHGEVLAAAAGIMSERGQVYGAMRKSFETAAAFASLKLGREVSPYEVVTIMESVKDARLTESPSHLDSYIDKVNYTTFRADFATD